MQAPLLHSIENITHPAQYQALRRFYDGPAADFKIYLDDACALPSDWKATWDQPRQWGLTGNKNWATKYGAQGFIPHMLSLSLPACPKFRVVVPQLCATQGLRTLGLTRLRLGMLSLGLPPLKLSAQSPTALAAHQLAQGYPVRGAPSPLGAEERLRWPSLPARSPISLNLGPAGPFVTTDWRKASASIAVVFARQYAGGPTIVQQQCLQRLRTRSAAFQAAIVVVVAVVDARCIAAHVATHVATPLRPRTAASIFSSSRTRAAPAASTESTRTPTSSTTTSSARTANPTTAGSSAAVRYIVREHSTVHVAVHGNCSQPTLVAPSPRQEQGLVMCTRGHHAIHHPKADRSPHPTVNHSYSPHLPPPLSPVAQARACTSAASTRSRTSTYPRPTSTSRARRTRHPALPGLVRGRAGVRA